MVFILLIFRSSIFQPLNLFQIFFLLLLLSCKYLGHLLETYVDLLHLFDFSSADAFNIYTCLTVLIDFWEVLLDVKLPKLEIIFVIKLLRGRYLRDRIICLFVNWMRFWNLILVTLVLSGYWLSQNFLLLLSFHLMRLFFRYLVSERVDYYVWCAGGLITLIHIIRLLSHQFLHILQLLCLINGLLLHFFRIINTLRQRSIIDLVLRSTKRWLFSPLDNVMEFRTFLTSHKFKVTIKFLVLLLGVILSKFEHIFKFIEN